MRSTRCGARRMISSATRPPIECPASAKEAGAVASTRSAIAPRLESGPVSWTRQSTNAPRRGSTGSHAARSQTSPGSSTSAPPRGGDAEEGSVCGCMADAIVCVRQARIHGPRRALAEPGEHPARIAFEDLGAVLSAQPLDRFEVASRVVVVMAGLRIDAAHRADHLRGEQDVVGRHHLQQELDAGLGGRRRCRRRRSSAAAPKTAAASCPARCPGSGPSGRARRRRHAG